MHTLLKSWPQLTTRACLAVAVGGFWLWLDEIDCKEGAAQKTKKVTGCVQFFCICPQTHTNIQPSSSVKKCNRNWSFQSTPTSHPTATDGCHKSEVTDTFVDLCDLAFRNCHQPSAMLPTSCVILIFPHTTSVCPVAAQWSSGLVISLYSCDLTQSLRLSQAKWLTSQRLQNVSSLSFSLTVNISSTQKYMQTKTDFKTFYNKWLYPHRIKPSCKSSPNKT